jgi:hypothetical protein
LTAEIAERLPYRLSEVAFYLLVNDHQDENVSLVTDEETDEEDDAKDDDDESAETILSTQLAASLRWNQHRILLTCSQGLQDWAAQQSFE